MVDICFRLRVGLIKSVPNATCTLSENELSLFAEAHDLGVLLDAQLLFKLHQGRSQALAWGVPN